MSSATISGDTKPATERRVYRVDHVGSLLRPQRLMQARAAFGAREISGQALLDVEDECILEAVRRQEQAGLGVITDGDFRRGAFHIDFLSSFEGIEWDASPFARGFQGGSSAGESPAVFVTSGKISHGEPICVDGFSFLRDCTLQTAKVTMPSPSFAHCRGGRAAIDDKVYPDLDVFFDDLAAAYRAEIAALAAAGCKYVQLDEVHFTFFCDPKMAASLKARGDDPDDLMRVYARLINDSIRDRPSDMTVGIHLCRGNRRSSWVAAGGYEPVAERMFNMIDADVFLLEFDDERSGDFAPLRFLRKGQHVVLGLVTSKSPVLEAEDTLMRRIEEASRYAPLDQLGIGPQCGFASSIPGNLIDEDSQWRKLALCAQVARRAWGRAD
jgi:5-methyltetrahydropteroyltriglutamate--homocysteine methyltransferase